MLRIAAVTSSPPSKTVPPDQLTSSRVTRLSRAWSRRDRFRPERRQGHDAIHGAGVKELPAQPVGESPRHPNFPRPSGPINGHHTRHDGSLSNPASSEPSVPDGHTLAGLPRPCQASATADDRGLHAAFRPARRPVNAAHRRPFRHASRFVDAPRSRRRARARTSPLAHPASSRHRPWPVHEAPEIAEADLVALELTPRLLSSST